MFNPNWVNPVTTEETNDILFDLASVHAGRIRHEATRQHLVACIARRDYRLLCDFDPPYPELSPWDAINVRQILAFFSKRGDIDLGIDRRRVAERKFIEAESLCRETNVIFDKRARGEFSFPPRVEAVLFSAQRKMAHLLGDVPTLAQLKLRFGPGATTRTPRRNANVVSKLRALLVASEDIGEHLQELLAELPHLADPVAQVTLEPGRLDFVPKNAKTDRAIVVEPHLNTLVQAGIGDYMAERLRSVGVDIRRQEPNQALAREGSLSGALATLDLSSASDTIAQAIVEELLPVDWVVFLRSFRTGRVVYQNYSFTLAKFSSMGNGFTFPLETAIFLCLARASTELSGLPSHPGCVRCYGDDIIVPTDAVPLLSEVLRCCGFLLNKDKSFWTGPFRESCGADYLAGIDVRPCFIKEQLSPRSLFTLHNFYWRRAEYELASKVLSLIPSDIRLFGPDGFGDGHLLCDDWKTRAGVRHKRHQSHGYSGWLFDTFRLRNKRARIRITPGDYVVPLYTIYAASPWGEDVTENRLRTTEAVLRGWRHWIEALEPQPASVRMYDGSTFQVTNPGWSNYDRISIYTLS
ncbi:MAG: RNA replicase beta chain [Sanya fiers-like virus 36]|nr:MAG: RNA replicase beta chain [Sanya fiers-like virus 36]